jgi:hypothetical protein
MLAYETGWGGSERVGPAGAEWNCSDAGGPETAARARVKGPEDVGITSGAAAARALERVERKGEGSTVRNGIRSLPAGETNVVLSLVGRGKGNETVSQLPLPMHARVERGR